MKARIAITADGKMGVFVEEGTLEEARPKLQALFALLEANDIVFDSIDDVEQHRHDDEHAHQQAYTAPHVH